MMRRVVGIIVAALAVAFGSGPKSSVLRPQEKSAVIRVLLLTGQNNHDWEHTSAIYEEVLEATGRFDVTVTTKPGEVLADAEALAKYDVFFLDYNGKRWGAAAEKNFVDAVSSGTGVVITHASNNPFDGWLEFEDLCGYLWRRGTGHGRFHEFDVDIVDRNHPITIGMPKMVAHPDELYHRLKHMHDAPYRILMTAHSSNESGGTGRDEPMAMVRRYGAGRIFHTPLGHVWRNAPQTHPALEDRQLHLLVGRGTEWAAAGTVTLAAEDFGLETPRVRPNAPPPHNPWVFRCVLDDNPRTVVVALNEFMWLGWDARTSRLVKTWGSGVKLQGAVFDTVHGPQPVVRGKPYWTLPDDAGWRLVNRKGNKETRRSVDLDYRGYAHPKKGIVTFRSELRLGDDVVTIRETPLSGPVVDAPPQLLRRFEIDGLGPNRALLLPVRIGAARDVVAVTVEAGDARLAGDDVRLTDGDNVIRMQFKVVD